jgi:uncharacterized protein (TIGR00730 family)
MMDKICVFCGSSTGQNPIYGEAASALGKQLAKKGIGLVYGGGNVGLMGILADAVLSLAGNCLGVIPQSIADLEIAHLGLSELHIVSDMPQRKQLMTELSDGFIAMPGGFGTLDELSEVLTYNQLRIYDKPVGLLNVNGYFNGLLNYLDHCVAERFVRDEHRQNIMVSDDPGELIELMRAYEPVPITKWIDNIKEERKVGTVNNKKI